MEFIETSVKGAFLIEPGLFEDDRGFFLRAFCTKEFEDAGIDMPVVQANLAGSRQKGTLRGLHYQIMPHEEGKLVRCVRGSVFDVVLDIRSDSETYGKWYGADLSASNRNMLYIPPGCAHGYQTLEPDSEVCYWISAFYTPLAQRGVRWDDPAFAIEWPIDDPILTERDRSYEDFDLGQG